MLFQFYLIVIIRYCDELLNSTCHLADLTNLKSQDIRCSRNNIGNVLNEKIMLNPNLVFDLINISSKITITNGSYSKQKANVA